MHWRAWYVGGEVFDGSTFEQWDGLPDDGMLFVVLCHADHTCRTESGSDWYWATPDGVFAHDTPGQVNTASDLTDRYPDASVKRGKWTTDADMARVNEEAWAWRDAWIEAGR